MDDYERRFLESLRDQRVGGRYTVERVLGAGGMGLVAAARHPELGQEVAIKFMRAELASDATLSARFLREARIAAQTRSPHFVRVFDFGLLESGVPYLVMEMLHGRDLGTLLQERGPLPVPQAVDYLLQTMVGLAELHARGVVHRDLKPANLFLAEAAGTRTVKVLDLGLSKETTTGLTTTGHSFGTPHYMSPEQIRESKSVDTRSDVWALGVILYELLTQALPFGQGANATGEVFGAVLHTEHVPLRHVSPELPEELERVAVRCLQRDSKNRFEDLAAFAEALRPFAEPASVPRIEAIREALRVPLGATKLVGHADVPAAPSTPPSTKKEPRAATPPNPPGNGPNLPNPPSEMVAVRANTPAPAEGAPHGGSSSARRWLVAAVAVAAIGVGAVVAVTKLGGPSPGSAAASVPSSASFSPTPTLAPAAPSSVGLAATAVATIPPLEPPAPSVSAAAAATATPRPPPARPAASATAAAPGHAGTSVLDGLDRK